MTIKEHLAHEIERLSEPELREVAEFVAFLKFRENVKAVTLPDEAEMAALYGEFRDEDRELAEAGMPDYVEGLRKEDTR